MVEGQSQQDYAIEQMFPSTNLISVERRADQHHSTREIDIEMNTDVK